MDRGFLLHIHMARGDDLHQDLDSRAGHTRSIYGSRGRVSTRDEGYLFGHDKPSHARAENRQGTPSEVRHSVAQHRGAAHPLCFTNEVMDHEFPEGFKLVNIESYDGTTDPALWIEDFILHIRMAREDDLHAIKYLPLKLKASSALAKQSARKLYWQLGGFGRRLPRQLPRYICPATRRRRLKSHCPAARRVSQEALD